MVRRFRRLTLGIAALVALTAIILALGVARSEAASAGEEASPPPTVVRELVEERTATGEVYLLSDGTKRTCLFEVPVHYRDADGTWQAIDRRLVPTGAPGVFASAATEAEVVVAGEGKGRLPVTISFDGASVGFDLLGAVEDQPLVLGDEKAHFLAVDTATDLTYAVTDRGVKETITLASKEAPDRFTFFLAHEDLTLKRDETGQWGFYRKGEKQPLFELSDLLVYDSSESAAGVADVCDEAAMTVTPAPGGSYLTYAVPRKWLEDESRVWPVMIDPSITLGQAVCIDTFVCSANPTSTYGSSTDLRAGRYDATTGWNRSLIKFAVSSIDDPGVPGVPYIHDANLRVRQYSGGSSPQTHVGVMEESWSNATTWNGLNDDGGVDFHNIGNPSVSANEWLEQGCKTYVQNWLDGDSTYPNYGFTIYQNSGEGANYYRKFRSSDYGTSTYRPRIEVEYDDDHYAGVSDYPASATIGETGSAVSVTMKTYTDYPGDVLKMELGLNLAAGVSSRYRGWLCWFRDDPGAGWTKQQLADGSYVAYQAGQLGNDRISVSFASCSAATTSTYRRVTFAFTLNENYGDVQDTDFDTKFAMGPGTNVTWSSGDWVSHDVNFDARPKPVTSAEKDAEGSELFFCGLGANDTVGSGRGWAKLVWNPVAGANGYHVYLLDGNAYRKVGTQTALEGDGKYHWSTQGKGIYPSDTQIAALSDGTTANPLLCDGSGAPGSGLDLRDDPNALYAKTAGTNVDGSGTYYFRIVPYNSAGALDVLSGSYFDVRLPGRSVASIDEQHVDADLGSWDGHSLGCRLDEGRLTSGVTDLAISSLGPAAELTRSYLSEAATTRYAPGWFFNFDQHLDLTDIGESPNKIVYVDEQGVEHDFLRSAPGGEWHEPNGLVATLTQNSDASWKLLFDQDQSHLTFSDAGVLLAETANGLTTDYEWSENELTITAANGQEIEVALSSGAVTGATYATASSGTRTVAYAGSGADWSVTYNGADTGANGTARTVAYSYANGRLTAVTQQAWPAGGSSATLAVIYDAGGRVTQVRYPDFDAQERPDARAEIDYHETEPQATVQRFGTVGATANQVISQSVYTWTPSSAQVPYLLDSVTDGFGDDETTTEYAYSDDLQLEEETVYDDEGDEISLYEADIDEDVLDGSHDVEAESIATEIDQQGEAQEAQTTTYDYDDEHQVVAESTTCDAAGKRTETRYTYDAVGNAIEEWQVYYDSAQTETPVVASYALRSYDGSGHMTMEKRLVSADYVEPGALEGEETPEDRTITNPVWAETTYSDFAPNGEPQTTVAKGVQLAPGGAAQDLTKTTTYDEFGNLLTQTDWGGRTEQSSVCDLAGRQLTATDAAGVVTHAAYDVLGNVSETYKTVDGADVKANWSATEYDAMGRALTVETYLSDENGDPTTQSEVTNVYDGSGHQLSSSDSTVGGEPEKWVYDASGNVTEHWALGVRNYLESSRSTRTAYDQQGQVTGESAPGNSAAAGASGSDRTSYDYAGQLTSEVKADGSSTIYAYDGTGEQVEAESTVSGTTTSAYGAAGRLASTTNERSFTTASTYDLLGRVGSATGSGQEATQATYNALGWVLQTVDASGVTVTRAYDAHGNVTSEARGSAGTTESTYDAANRLVTQVDPNGNLLTCAYDAFGRLHEEKHEDWSSNLLKDVVTAHDSLGRPTSQTEAVSGRTSTWTYPLNAPAGIEESVSFEGDPASFTFGNEAAETGSDYGLVNIKVVGRFTLGEAASVAKLTGRISNDDSGHKACAMRALIYADSGGAPGALLASGVRVEVADGAAAAWVELPFAEPVGLTAGDYWIGLIGDAAASALDLRFAATGGATAWAYDSYADGASDPFGSAGSAACKLAIYASCEVGGAAVTTEVERSARGVETSREAAIGSVSTQDAASYLGYSAVSSASTSYSGAVTVPEGADFALIGIAYWNQADGSAPPTAISLDGQAAAQVGSVTYEPYRETLAVYRVAGFESGSKTFACSWASVGDGVHYTILYCSGVDAERPVRDYEYVTNIGGAVTSPPFASSAGDLVCAFASSGNGAPTMTGGGQTLVESGGPESGAWWGSAYKAGSGNAATITLSGCGGAQMMGLSLRPASTTQNATVTRAVADDANGRDTADRWTSASLQLSGFNALTMNRSFDDAGRVASQSGAGFDSAGSYSYHAAKGLKTRQHLPLALGGRIEDNYAYASDGRLETWSVGPSATPTPMATYSYDPAGNLTGDGATTFTYSASGQGSTPNRLVSSTTGGATTVYGWDQANAWRTSQGPTGDPDQVQYTYVKSGASTSNGRMTRYQNEATETEATYAYDASGQRLTSDVTVDSVQTVTRFTYDGLTLLNLTATQGTDSWRIDYLYDEEGALYGGVYRSPAHSSVATPFTVITNDHGDVLELLDANGSAFASYRYDPWGLPVVAGTTITPTSLISSALANDIFSCQVLRYASYAYDAESGLYYCSARYYDPATRQWTTGDPAKADGEESAYQYCAGTPVIMVDSSGTKPAIRKVVENWRKYRNTEAWSGWVTVARVRLSNRNGVRLGNLIQHEVTSAAFGLAVALITKGQGRVPKSSLIKGAAADAGIGMSLEKLGDRVKYYSRHAPPGLTVTVQKFLLVTPFTRVGLDGHVIAYYWHPF